MAGIDCLDYLSPATAAKMVGLTLYELNRLVVEGRGPAIARFTSGWGGWRVRRDQLEQWLRWEQFLADWTAQRREAA